MYDESVVPCVMMIKESRNAEAYALYRNTVENLSKEYIEGNDRQKG